MSQAMPIPEDETRTLRLERHFAASPEAVFKAWTDPAALAAWFGPQGVETRNVEIDLRPGGRYSLEMCESDGVYPLSGVYREVTPPRRLVMTWVWGHGELDGLEMLVTIELASARGGTDLTLIHENLPSDTAREKHEGGWTGCLESLEQFLAA